MLHCKLSVLYATLPSREKPYLNKLKELCHDWAEIIIDDSIGNLGEKRQRMLEAANGEYVSVIDDDDDFSENYFTEIKKGIAKDVDCVCIGIVRYEDGVFKQINRMGLKNPYEGIKSYAGYFSPTKKELALKSGYRSIGKGEDIDHMFGLIPLLKTAHYVSEPLINQYYVTREKEYDKYPNFLDVEQRVICGSPLV